jgi:hypothetical protein
MLNSSPISLFSMSVLKKTQLAAAPTIGDVDWPIIGAGIAECQKSVLRAPRKPWLSPCSIAAR